MMFRLTYANVMATAAMFVALGGTSYAAVKLQKGSVGERELKTGAVTSAKIQDGAVTDADLAPGTLRSGPRGPRGSDGPAGPTGPALAAPEAWKPLEFVDTNGWTNYSIHDAQWERGGFRKDAVGVVSLRGLVTFAIGAPASTSKIAQLPVGYRPKRSQLFVVHTGGGNAYKLGRVDIASDGWISWIDGQTGPLNYTSLDGITFSID